MSFVLSTVWALAMQFLQKLLPSFLSTKQILLIFQSLYIKCIFLYEAFPGLVEYSGHASPVFPHKYIQIHTCTNTYFSWRLHQKGCFLACLLFYLYYKIMEGNDYFTYDSLAPSRVWSTKVYYWSKGREKGIK